MVNTTATIKTTSGHTGQHCLRKGNKMNDKDIEPQQAFPYTGLGSDGMTLRDYFAAKVMEAMHGPAWVLKQEEIPARAYKMADLMMEARKQ
jgi:hypothetical protein